MRNINNYEKEYSNHSFEDIQVQYRRKKILEQMRKYPHNHILEIGCAMEPIFKYVDDFQTMTIVEPGLDFIENAKKLSANNSSIRCIQGFFEEKTEELSKQTYDFIILSSLLHELESPEKMLNALKKICSENTVIHINVPNANSLHRILAKEMGLIENVSQMSAANIKLQQHSVFAMNTFIELIESRRFKIIDKGSYFVKPFTHKQMCQMLETNIIDANLLDGLYKLVEYLPEFGSEIYVDCKIL